MNKYETLIDKRDDAAPVDKHERKNCVVSVTTNIFTLVFKARLSIELLIIIMTLPQYDDHLFDVDDMQRYVNAIDGLSEWLNGAEEQVTRWRNGTALKRFAVAVFINFNVCSKFSCYLMIYFIQSKRYKHF
jgi:hypothetical protein